MLEDLAQRIDSVQRDTVIVFHQIGSHGPAYAERYPPEFEIFKPVCRSSELQRCTAEEVRNAYDNSIAYTDYVLSRQIEMLRQASDRFDTVLIYASDHGESLGELGVYLHGMPYAFAPEDQKRVPFLIWTSPAFRSRMGLDDRCLHTRAHQVVSHDNLYHTVLSVAGLSNQVYDPKLDLLQACRSLASL
jgi:lipid A ethanolaminephosphotransferase